MRRVRKLCDGCGYLWRARLDTTSHRPNYCPRCYSREVHACDRRGQLARARHRDKQDLNIPMPAPGNTEVN